MKIQFLAILLFVSNLVFSQSVTVPSKMEFAGMKIHFNSSARKKVQHEVDKIRKSPKYFKKHVDQANVYFPLIEDVFKSYDFPTDFKYLIIQESAFNGNAVSSSKAVGYWQFKEGTAKEVGLVVSDGIDERKNIYASTLGAAKYISKTNQKLDNWVYALLSYNVGPGGVMSYFKEKDKGVKKMEVTSKMHWYVIKFLAHKIAFQDEVGKEHPPMTLYPDFGYAGKNLKQIAKLSNSSLDGLEEYNLWLNKSKKIPSDKEYAVIFPMKRGTSVPAGNPNVEVLVQSDKTDTVKYSSIVTEDYTTPFDPNKNIRLEINHIPVITAKKGDYLGRLAIKANVPKKKFAKYNEITTATPLVPGIPYFTKKKKSKAIVAFYTVKPGEDLWMISQKYGVKMFSIRTKNRMTDLEPVIPGRVLYMRQTRPEYIPVEIKQTASKENNIELVQGEESVQDSIKPNTTPIIQEAVEPKRNSVDSIKGVSKELQADTVKTVEVIEEKKKEQQIDSSSLPNEEVVNEVRKKKVHVVEKGETLYSISKKYKVTVDELKSENSLKDMSLSVGQELSIPVMDHVTKKEVSHIVVKGDTMYGIAKKYNVKVYDIMTWNNKTSAELSLGEVLIILK